VSESKLEASERAPVLRSFEKWAAERSEERALRQDVAQFIRERVVEAGCREETCREVDEALDKALAADFDA
jgi:uncharacterized protein YpiB (UPF0302 family)